MIETSNPLKECWDLLELEYRPSEPGPSREALRKKIAKYFERYISDVALRPSALYGLGILWYYSNEVAGAAERAQHYLAQALQEDPSNEWARMTLAILSFEDGRYADALRFAQRVDRLAFTKDPSISWRALKVDEIELAARVLLDEVVSDDEWRNLIGRYAQDTLDNDGPTAFPSEAILAAKKSGKTWAVDGLRRAVALPWC